MQGEGDSYIYFGHVGQMLLGEDLARRGVGGALDYVMRDVEMRLDTELYVIQNGQAGTTISAAWQQDSAADRLETLHDGAGLRSDSMSRTVRNVLSDLERCGASFAPALTGDGTLSTAGYALLRDGVLVGWAEGAAAAGVNLLLSRVDADVVELPQADGTAALRVVGAKTRIRGVFDGEVLTGMDVKCRVEANLAEGAPALQEEAAAAAWRRSWPQWNRSAFWPRWSCAGRWRGISSPWPERPDCPSPGAQRRCGGSGIPPAWRSASPSRLSWSAAMTRGKTISLRW